MAGACRSKVVSVSGRAARRQRRRGGAAGACWSEVVSVSAGGGQRRRRRRGSAGERPRDAAGGSYRARVPGEISVRLRCVSIFCAKFSLPSTSYPFWESFRKSRRCLQKSVPSGVFYSVLSLIFLSILCFVFVTFPYYFLLSLRCRSTSFPFQDPSRPAFWLILFHCSQKNVQF